MEIENITGSVAYLTLLSRLIKSGELVSPRGMPVREIRNVTVIILDPQESHVLWTSRRPSKAIAATEALHLIAGASSLEQLNLASGGRFTQFADRGRLRGAYGPRAYRQLFNVVRILSSDQDSRQAVVSIWDGRETREESHDVPCTLSYQFFIRGKFLDLRTSMRSNDAWLGFPYDIEVARALHLTVASCLGIQAGSYTHTVGSMHLYERDLAKAEAAVATGISADSGSPREPAPPLEPSRSISSAILRWQSLTHTALGLARGCVTSGAHGQAWYEEAVPSLPESSTFFCSSCRYITPQPCVECPPPRTVDVPVTEGVL